MEVFPLKLDETVNSFSPHDELEKKFESETKGSVHQVSGASLELSKSEDANQQARLLGYVELSEEKLLPMSLDRLGGYTTKRLVLNNGLKVFLASSPSYDASAFNLSVKAGRWQDPIGRVGMASFCWDLIETGPCEDGGRFPLLNLLAKYEGEVGGDLDELSTEYRFKLKEAGKADLGEFLEMFGDFFSHLRWSQEEIEVCSKDFMESIKDMGVLEPEKVLYVQHHLMSKEHPAHSMERQALKDLQGIQAEEVHTWLDKHYTPDKMSLVITSPLPINDLVDVAVQGFGKIAKAPSIDFKSEISILSEKTAGKWVDVYSQEGNNAISILWEIPSELFSPEKNTPWSLGAHLLGDESECSLLAQLKREGLAEELVVGTRFCASGQGIFYLNVDLTPKGFEEKEAVFERIYQAIQLFTDHSYPDYVLQNLQDIDRMNYLQNVDSTAIADCNMYAKGLLETNHFASFPQNMQLETYAGADAVKQFMTALKPERGHHFIFSPKALAATEFETEPHSSAPYCISEFDKSRLERFLKTQDSCPVDFIPENTFIATNASLIPSIQKKKEEGANKVIVDLARSHETPRIFIASDTLYYNPTCELKVALDYVDDKARSLKGIVVSDLLDLALWEKSRSLEYALKLVNGDCSFIAKSTGIVITLNALRKSVFKAIGPALHLIKDLNLSGEEFSLMKERLIKKYDLLNKKSSTSSAVDIGFQVLDRDYVTFDQRIEEISKMSKEEFDSLLQERLQNLRGTGFLFGNVDQEDADVVSNALQSSNLSVGSTKVLSKHCALLPNSLLVHGTFDGSDNLSVRLTIQKKNVADSKESIFMSYLKALLEMHLQEHSSEESTDARVTLVQDGGQAYLTLSAGDQDLSAKNLLQSLHSKIDSFLSDLTQGKLKEHFNDFSESTLIAMDEHPDTAREMAYNLYQSTLKGMKRSSTPLQTSLRESTYSDFVGFSQSVLDQNLNPSRLAICVNDKEQCQLAGYETLSLAEAQDRCLYTSVSSH